MDSVKVGLTGAGGFIGRLLAERLAERNHELVLVDPVRHPARDTLAVDYASPEGLAALADCEVVVHLAAISGILSCARDPVGARRTNISGLCALADELQSRQTPLLFASSFSVVGSPTVLPIFEDAPFSPLNEYARQKTAGEMVVRSLGPAGRVLRMSNIYGTYPLNDRTYRKGNVLSLFVEQARAGRLRINAPGTQARDFLHVEDAVRHWIAAAERAGRGEDPGATYHLASGEVWSVRGLAEELQKLLPARVPEEVVANPREESLLSDFRIDTRSTRRRLGIEPIHSVLETLRAELASPPNP
ncbi:MAG: NAD-dependent epimerase/dehydratase family protein [Thermoplasmata archaeon]